MNVLPPGGYQYVQPETGMAFDGNTLFRAQARLIEVHRRANALARATLAEATEDLMAYTCDRVPGVCVEGKTDQAGAPRQYATAPRRCGSCGGRKAK